MGAISSLLRIKYGLETDPSEIVVQKWITQTSSYINRGYGYEDAGAKAAKELFPDFGRWIYRSETDSVYALLLAAQSKTF